ncbi:MAG TPA: hypothetical protein VGO78_27680 [Acidimicrobiales bacterium]|jgi:hypothetical protein|nr:hypothetical protein [Acidimicrobiales bacterium]
MQEVLRYIGERTAQQRPGPFLTWLSDASVPPQDRLVRWLPCAAPWVFGFMDLNGVLLRYPDEAARDDRYKQAINDHVDEDAQHWSLYLEDLHRLGLDAPLALADLLRFLWGSETRAQRLAVYRLSVLAARAEAPLLRYCLVATIESFAHLLFATLQQVAAQAEPPAAGELLYVGSVHAEKEPGHLANQSGAVEADLRAEVLDGPTRRRGLDIVRQVADLIEERWNELHRCGRSDRYLTFLRSA